jgi:FKBP-type peptidyl-prolyl cis-trans isomerase
MKALTLSIVLPLFTALAVVAAPSPSSPANLADMELYGWTLGAKLGLSHAHLTDGELSALIRGLTLSTSPTEGMSDLRYARALSTTELSPADQLEKLTARQSLVQASFSQRLRDAKLVSPVEGEGDHNAAFLTKLDTFSYIQSTKAGLRYIISQPTSGAHPQPSSLVKIKYTGTLPIGTTTTFLTHTQGGKGVITAEIWLNQASPALSSLLQLMTSGSTYEFYLPKINRGVPFDYTPDASVTLISIK